MTVWRTEAAFEEFARERLLPAARALGISPVRPQIFPIHELLAPPSDQVRSGGDFEEAVSHLLRTAQPRLARSRLQDESEA